MANAEYQQDELKTAISRLENIINERHTAAVLKARSWMLLGKVAEKNNSPEEAIHCYNRVLTLFPGFADIAEATLRNLVEIYALENNYPAMESLLGWLETSSLHFAHQWKQKIRQRLPAELPEKQSEQT
jgi:outer membrane protein assembly factor BamD (BamD/ComL family)